MQLQPVIVGEYVLVLGNNNDSTDLAVTDLARQGHSTNHGLIDDPAFIPTQAGFYHTTVVDLAWADLVTLAQRFHKVIMLDQPVAQWSHWKCLQATCKLMLKLEESGVNTQFRHNANVKRLLYWIDLVYKQNPSFCIYPWINFHNNGQDLKLCSRDPSSVTKIENLQDWSTDPAYQDVRKSMLDGKLLHDHCSVCYRYENLGMESYRQFETIDWITRLELDTVNDLANIKHPFFYEVHTGNHCNIKCRGCQPSFSDAIGRELKKFNIKAPGHLAWRPAHYSLDRIDIDQLDSKAQVYFQGGEPTIMPEVRDFLGKCISQGKTDFSLTMCTNGVKISDDFLQLIGHFPHTNFSFSIDGYGKINDYWRSGSKWDRVIENAHRMQALGHSVTINTVPGLYNVTNMHLLFEFLDKEFPFTAIYMQINYLPWQSAYNHPLHDLVIDSMYRCQQTSVYHSNGKSCKTSIDSLLSHYLKRPACDLIQLKTFFDYNDQLDAVRGTRLIEYIPELETARQWLQQAK